MVEGLAMGAVIALAGFFVGYFVQKVRQADDIDEVEYEYRKKLEEKKDVEDTMLITSPAPMEIFRIKSGKKKGLLSYKKFVRDGDCN
jgi:hypothetical protein